MEIRVLARQGHSIKAIARELGVSRNTVRKYLRGESYLPAYRSRTPRPTKLDPFTDYLRERVAAAHPRWIPATVLLREIQERGYEGGISQLKVFLAPFKKREAEPVVRFETDAGQQMQADFTTIRRGREPLKAFVATLGYSRATFVLFSVREDSPAWLEGLRGAFAYFGGVPAEVLFDNASSIITERDAYGAGQHRWQRELAALAEEYGFRPRVCRPYRARTKGKVERFNRYLKESFVTPLAATLKSAGLHLDVEAANAHVGRWLEEVAHQRVHGTTGVKPAVRLAEEREVLLPLPAAAQAVPAAAPQRAGQVLPILRDLVAVHREGPLFPARTGAKGELIDHRSIKQAIDRWLASDGVTVAKFQIRDLRRTWKSRTHDAGIDRFTRDLIQQHAKTDTGSKNYDRADYLPQMREAMAKWEAWLDQVLELEPAKAAA